MRDKPATKSLRIVRDWEGSDMTEPGPLATDTRLLERPAPSHREATPMADSVTPEPAPVQPPRRGLRDRWRAEVMRTSRMGDATKLLLLALHEDMDHRGYVSVGRPILAGRIGRSERRVSERLSEAVERGYLDHVVRGHRGVTPVYRAMLPESETATSPLSGDSETIHSPLSRREVSPDRLAMDPNSGTPGGPTSSKAHRTQSPTHSPSVSGPTSELLSENDELDPAPQTAEARALILRAIESWGMEPPAEFTKAGAA